MDSSLEEKIKDIGSMFGITEIPDSITTLIGSFINQEEPTDQNDRAEMCPNYEQKNHTLAEADFDILKIMELINKYQTAKQNANNDKNIQLLRALGPFLSPQKRKKIKNCEKMLTLMKMI